MSLFIYHADTLDGMMCAAVACRTQPNVPTARSNFLQQNYGDLPPNGLTEDVTLLGFYYKRDQILSLLNSVSSLTIIANQPAAEPELAGLSHPNLKVIYDQSKSRTLLAWEHYYPNQDDFSGQVCMAKYIDMAVMNPTKTANDVVFVYSLYEYSCLPDFAKALVVPVESLDELTNIGTTVWRYRVTEVERLVSNVNYVNICGHEVPCCNALNHYNEWISERLFMKQAPFVAIHRDSAWGQAWSLRANPNILYNQPSDVGAIARSFGGDGSKTAAGFRFHWRSTIRQIDDVVDDFVGTSLRRIVMGRSEPMTMPISLEDSLSSVAKKVRQG